MRISDWSSDVCSSDLFELVLDPLIFVGVGGRFLLDRDVRPLGAELRVHLEPLFEPALGVGQDRLGRAFGFADAAVDALVRVDDEIGRASCGEGVWLYV